MTTLGKSHRPDRIFLLISLVLLVSGLLILASASLPLSQRDHGNSTYYLVRQVTLGGSVGLIGALIAQLLPLSLLRRLSVPALVVTLGLLAVSLLPGVGLQSGGATRWLHAGPVTIQPGELAKITLPLYLAAWLSTRAPVLLQKRRRGSSQKTYRGEENENESVILPFLVIVGSVGLLLLLQPDLSTFGILALTSFVLLYLSGVPWRVIALLLTSGIAALAVLIRMEPYRINRILSFTNPQADPLGIGYQVNQALLAVGSGGLLGRGIGFSREKLFYLPEPMGDSIFAVFAEEAGFVGATILILLFALFLWRGFMIVRRLPDPFVQLFCAGLVSWIVLQALFNIGGNIALLPLVGITLPFVSYGSASLAVTLISVGFIYKMSRYTRL